MLPNARFFSAIIPDPAADRSDVFKEALTFLHGTDLLFFDPDNGIEVASVRRGARDSSKYVYWDEIEAAYRAGHSVLIYQHFPRERRGPYTERLAARLAERTNAARVFTFATSRVLFLLAAQPRHMDALSAGAEEVAHRWSGQLQLATHEPAISTTETTT